MIEAPNASEIPDWLRECFEQTQKPDVITTDFIIQWGTTLLDAKIEHRKLDPKFRWGAPPKKLRFDELGAALMYLCSFKRMALPQERDALGIRIDATEGIWNSTSKRIGEYFTDHDFINQAILLITPTHKKLETPHVTRYIKDNAPEMILPIPPRDTKNERTVADFWRSFEEIYDWDMIPLELMYRTYHRWCIIYRTTDEKITTISPVLFKEQIRLLSSERWIIIGTFMSKR